MVDIETVKVIVPLNGGVPVGQVFSCMFTRTVAANEYVPDALPAIAPPAIATEKAEVT
jgi:hypothetical protein